MPHAELIHIAFFEPYPMGLGGNFLTQRLILERLNREWFHPIVVSPVEGIALDRFREMGVECVVIPPPGELGNYGGAILRSSVLSKLKSGFDLLKYNLKLARFLTKRQIDIVYANCVRAEMSIGLGARLAVVPSFLYVKGELSNPVIDSLSFILATRIYFQCGQNRDDKYHRLVNFYYDKIGILKPGMDPNALSSVNRYDTGRLCDELCIDMSYINAVVPSQLYPLKGQHIAIEALSRLVNDFPKVRLYLLGDHVIDEYRFYKLELEQLILKYKLEKNVIFTGWRGDSLDIISLMDIVIHPSFSEGFPRAVLESMGLGKPVIATRVGGLREAIKDSQNGFLFDPGNVDILERRWRDLLVNPDLRLCLGQAARQTVFSDYLIDDKVSRLADIWTEMAMTLVKNQ